MIKDGEMSLGEYQILKENIREETKNPERLKKSKLVRRTKNVEFHQEIK